MPDREDRRPDGDDDGATLTIVALGDSTTAVDDWSGQDVAVYPELLPEALAAFGVRARVVNAGIGGTTTRDALERLDRDVGTYSPDLVVIQFGINDSWIDADEGRREPRLTRDEYRENLRRLVRQLVDGGAQVVLVTPNPMRWSDPYYMDVFQKAPGLLDTGSERGLNALLDLYVQDARDVAEQERVPLVDVHRAFEEYGAGPGRSVGDLLLDGIHPNAAGQRLVCRELAAAIATLVRASPDA